MKIKLFYFTGTGNTWWLCSKLKEELHKENIECDIQPIRDDTVVTIEEFEQYNKIGLAYPIYAFNPPKLVREFVQKLPDSNKDIFVIANAAGGVMGGSRVFGGMLRKKGYKFRQSFHAYMPTNLSDPPTFKLYDKQKRQKQKAEAEQKLKAISSAIKNNTCSKEGWLLYPLAKMASLFESKMLESYSKRLKVNNEKCTKCGLCAKICPKGNIAIKDELPQIGSNCIACVRCLNFCPANALYFAGKDSGERNQEQYKGPIDGLKISEII